MHAAVPSPPRIPQRVVVAGAPGPALDGFLAGLAAALDVPVVPLADLAGPEDLLRLAAFEGWVVPLGYAEPPPPLLDRAEVVLHHAPEVAGSLRGLVRRTVRRLRADAAPEPDVTWLEPLAAQRPDLTVVRLAGAERADAWLAAL